LGIDGAGRTVPITELIATPTSPMESDIREPVRILEYRSRPSSSVPNRNS